MNSVIRYLGIYIEQCPFGKLEKKNLFVEMKTLIRKLALKKMTTAHLTYINNHVLLPRLVYRMQHMFFDDKVCDRLHHPFLRLVKYTSNMSSKAEQNIVHSEGFLTCKKLYEVPLGICVTRSF